MAATAAGEPQQVRRTGHEPRFAVDLWDGFGEVCKRTEVGLEACSDILAFVKERAKIEADYAKQLGKLAAKQTQGTTTKFGITKTINAANEQDGSTAAGWKALIHLTEQQAAIHGQTAQQLDDRVVTAIGKFVKDMDGTRKQIFTDGTRLLKDQKDTMEAYEKARDNYLKLSKEAEKAKLAAEEADQNPNLKSKDRSKISIKMTKANQAKHFAEEDYKYKIKVANSFQERFQTESMPKILDDFQHLETVRIHLLKVNMKKFVKILEATPPASIHEFAQCKTVIDAIDNEADIEQFIYEHRTGELPPPPIEYAEYEEGTQELKVKQSMWNRSFGARRSATPPTPIAAPSDNVDLIKTRPVTDTPRPKTSTSVFNVTIDELMANEGVDAEAPRIVTTLCDAIMELNGHKTEGIFRIPGDAMTIATLRDRFDGGDFTIDTPDVHVPAALLKLWLRELEVPLIVPSLYERAVKSDSTSACGVVDDLPPNHQKVVRYLVRFLREIAAPENSEITKMTADNVSIVFAPAFLRCPSDDPTVILRHTEPERVFVLELLNGLDVDGSAGGEAGGSLSLPTGPPAAAVARVSVNSASSGVSSVSSGGGSKRSSYGGDRAARANSDDSSNPRWSGRLSSGGSSRGQSSGAGGEETFNTQQNNDGNESDATDDDESSGNETHDGITQGGQRVGYDRGADSDATDDGDSSAQPPATSTTTASSGAPASPSEVAARAVSPGAEETPETVSGDMGSMRPSERAVSGYDSDATDDGRSDGVGGGASVTSLGGDSSPSTPTAAASGSSTTKAGRGGSVVVVEGGVEPLGGDDTTEDSAGDGGEGEGEGEGESEQEEGASETRRSGSSSSESSTDGSGVGSPSTVPARRASSHIISSRQAQKLTNVSAGDSSGGSAN